MKNSVYTSIFYLIIIIIFSSCTTTREITSTSELKNYRETGDITVVTKDSIKYILTFYSLKDSVLEGKGTVRVKDTVKIFNGKINYRDIGYVECKKTDFLKTVAGIGSTAIVSFIILKYLRTEEGISNTVKISSVGCK